LRVPRLIPTGLEVNNQVSFQWPSILTITRLEPEKLIYFFTRGDEGAWDKGRIVNGYNQYFWQKIIGGASENNCD